MKKQLLLQICSLSFFLLLACEEREVLDFEVLYNDEVKSLYDEPDACANVNRTGIEIRKVPIDESLQSQGRPYQLFSIQFKGQQFYQFGFYESNGEPNEEIILAYDNIPLGERVYFHYNKPDQNLGNYLLADVGSFLQIFIQDLASGEMKPTVYEIIHEGLIGQFGSPTVFWNTVNIVNYDYSRRQVESSLFYVSERTDQNRGIIPYGTIGREVLDVQRSLLCDVPGLLGPCSVRTANSRFAYANLESDFLIKELNTTFADIDPNFWQSESQATELNNYLNTWNTVVHTDKLFEQIGCFNLEFDEQDRADLQLPF